jgi:HEAT repeat protein
LFSRYFKTESSRALDLESGEEPSPTGSGSPDPAADADERFTEGIAEKHGGAADDHATAGATSTSNSIDSVRADRYIVEATLTLRTAESPSDRVAAAQILGAVGGQRETALLIAALFDDAPEVRYAAGEALARIGDPTVSFGPLSTLMSGNVDWGAPEVVQSAMPAEEPDTQEAAPATSTSDEPLTLAQTTVEDPLIKVNEESVRSDEHAITNSENEARSLGQQELELRLEVLRLRHTADELAQRRVEIEEAARAARVEDAEQKRREAAELHTAELEHLRSEEDALRVATEQVAHRRRGVEAAFQESRILLRQLEEEQAQQAEALEALRDRIELETKERAEKERQIRDDLERLRIAGVEAELELLAAREQAVKNNQAEESRDDPILEKLKNNDPLTRAGALSELAQSGAKDLFGLIVNCFDDQSVDVRNAAARALHELDPCRPVEAFTRALDKASHERRQNIGTAIATSGLAAEAIEALCGDNREDTYNALCLLFAMAKTGELQPLVKAVEGHKDVEVRRAAVKLLTLAGQEPIAGVAAKRRLDVEV